MGGFILKPGVVEAVGVQSTPLAGRLRGSLHLTVLVLLSAHLHCMTEEKGKNN